MRSFCLNVMAIVRNGFGRRALFDAPSAPPGKWSAMKYIIALFVFMGWMPRIFAQGLELKPEWSGDLRYRLVQAKEAEDQPRPYQQLRARLQVKAEVNPELRAVIRLATASSAISTNQTLGDSKDPGFARRSFGLDLAAMQWTAVKGLTVSGGRVPNPYFSAGKNQLVFDSDLNFEGLSVQYKTGGFFVNAGAFLISENYDSATRSDVVDIGIPGFQLGYSHDFGGVQATIHYANQNYVNVQDQLITSLDKGASYDMYSIPFDRYRGNSIYRLLPGDPFRMSNKYVLDIVGAEVKSKLALVDVNLFADFVKNREVSTDGSGHEFGIGFKWERTSLGFGLIRKEADSIIGAYSDSDANGGGTDADGRRITVGYQFSDNSAFAINQYNAKRGISSTERDYSLTQVDFMMNF